MFERYSVKFTREEFKFLHTVMIPAKNKSDAEMSITEKNGIRLEFEEKMYVKQAYRDWLNARNTTLGELQ